MRRVSASITLKVCASIAVCFLTTTARAAEKEAVLRACEKEFGHAVDAKQNLFELNSLFVLQARFDDRGALELLFVSPKYFFEESHPEWTEPDSFPTFSELEYNRLLTRLDNVKARGRLIKSVENGVVTNSTAYFMDEYDNAIVERGEYGYGNVRFARLYFFRKVGGVVRVKHFCNYSFIGKGARYGFYHATIGECGYFIHRNTFASLRVGRKTSFLAAGPVRGMCGVGVECKH